MTEHIKAMMPASLDLADLTATAREEGMDTLRQVAIRKMLEGVTTYEEVISMTG